MDMTAAQSMLSRSKLSGCSTCVSPPNVHSKSSLLAHNSIPFHSPKSTLFPHLRGFGIRTRKHTSFGPIHASDEDESTDTGVQTVVNKGKEATIKNTSQSFLSIEDTGYRDSFKTYAYQSTVRILKNQQIEGFKVNDSKRSHRSFNDITNDAKVFIEGDNSVSPSSSKGRTSHYSLLLENLNILEESFTDLEALKLEKDILLQLGRLGALQLFNACLTKTLEATNVSDLSHIPTENIGECKIKGTSNDHVIVRTTKKEERKSKREKASSKNGCKAHFPWLLKHNQSSPGKHAFSSNRKAPNSKSRRLMMAKNEVEMAKGVKVLANLEKLRKSLEDETGQDVSLSCWAKVAKLDVKVLQQHLSFGWYCRDELIRSTRPLIVYFARNYRGMGIDLEDLLQAGNLGVLRGAERFDPTRGYKFSTYVQYWIRKSMSKIVSRYARGIQIPCSLSRTVNQIQKARKALSTSNGRHPDDTEIAKFTGLSVAKIESASKCLKVVGSIDKKMGEWPKAKYLEYIPDTSVQSPGDVVMRQHMIKDVHDLLRGLGSRERQILILRFGFKDYQPKSLEEIGRQFHVSKEWVRRLEKRVLTRLRTEETCRDLRHYMNSQFSQS